MNIQYFILGLTISSIYLYIFFGTKIECNTVPNIEINIYPFVKKSKIYIFNKHIHHWLIGGVSLLLIGILHFFYNNKWLYFLQGFSIIQILHGLLYQDCFEFD